MRMLNGLFVGAALFIAAGCVPQSELAGPPSGVAPGMGAVALDFEITRDCRASDVEALIGLSVAELQARQFDFHIEAWPSTGPIPADFDPTRARVFFDANNVVVDGGCQ